jgi:hypothetical protein
MEENRKQEAVNATTHHGGDKQYESNDRKDGKYLESGIKQAGKQTGYSHRRRSRPWYPVADGLWISSSELHRRPRRRALLKATVFHWQIVCVWVPLHIFRR